MTLQSKPRRALEIAIVGNRRFAGETDSETNDAARTMAGVAGTACRAVWLTIVESMTAAFDSEVVLRERGHGLSRDRVDTRRLEDFFSDDVPRLGVLSSLAAGADQIGTSAALAVGDAHGSVAFEIEAVLPFSEADYPGKVGSIRSEFRPDEAERLRSLAKRARQVVRLGGRYDLEDDRHRAYQMARDLILQHADAVVAVYDPDARGRVAGTQETIGLALSFGMPVIAVLLNGNEARIAVYAEPSDRPVLSSREWEIALPLPDDRWKRAIHAHILRLVELPHQHGGSSERPDETAARQCSLAETVERLEVFYGTRQPAGARDSGILASVYRASWNLVLRIGRWFAHPLPSLGRDVPRAPAITVLTIEPYASVYRRASDLSERYMRTYRGMFVLSFLLAGAAVSAAVLLLAASVLTGQKPPLYLVLVLGGIKVGIITVLLAIASASHRHRYQEHAADYRYLAELVRPMQSLAPLGTVVPFVELPAHSAPLDPRHGWTPWLVRALSRATSCVVAMDSSGASSAPAEVEFDVAYAHRALTTASREWIQGQIQYHWHHAQRMQWIDDGLEHVAKGVLYVVLVSAATAWVIETILAWPIALPHVLHVAATGLGAAAAALPAFSAALGGIMFQSEAKRLKLRSEAMYHGLVEHQRVLESERAALEGPRDSHGGEAWLMAIRLRALAAVVIQETSDWKVLYQTHEVHAG